MNQLEIMTMYHIDRWHIYQPTLHYNGQTMSTKGDNILFDHDIKTHWDMELIEIGIGRDNLSILRAVSNAILSRRYRIAPWIK